MKRVLAFATVQLSVVWLASAWTVQAQELDPLRLAAHENEAEVCTKGLSCDGGPCASGINGTVQSNYLSDDAFSKILKYSAMLLKSNMDEPLKFAVHTPSLEEIESQFSITVCGHVCDGNVCYEDSAASPSDIQVDSITVQDGAPPMPMLTLSRVPKTVETSTEGTASVSLNAPIASEVKSLELENLELKTKLAAMQREMELRTEHHAEVRELLAANSQLAVQVAELSASQESTEAMVSLMIEKSEIAAELQAAKEWIGQQVASTATQPMHPDVIVELVQRIEELRTEIREGASSTSVVGKRASLPVPFARSSYVPVFTELQQESVPCEGACVGSGCDSTCEGEVACGNGECTPTHK